MEIIIELRKGVSRKRFGIEAIQESDKDVHYYKYKEKLRILD